MLIDSISDIIAKELNIPATQVREINRIQWKFLLKEIQSVEFNSVQIFYLGKFYLNKKYNKDGTRRKYIKTGKRDI